MPYLKRATPSPEPINCKILTAALDLFVNKGFHNVSIHEVQKQADVSIGSIYNHFGGKEGIASALYKHILNEMDELVDDVINEVSSPSAQCKEIIRQLFEYTDSQRNIMAFVFHAKHTDFLSSVPLICNSSPFIKMREIIEKGIAAGEFKETDSWVAASCIFGGAIRMIQLRLDGLIKEPLINSYDALIDSAWMGLSNDSTVVASTPAANYG